MIAQAYKRNVQSALQFAGRGLDVLLRSMECAKFFRQYLEEALGQEEVERAASGGIAAGEKLDRSSLEGEDIPVMTKFSLILSTEEARQSTLPGHGTPEER